MIKQQQYIRAKVKKIGLMALGLLAAGSLASQAQESPMEEDFFKIVKVSAPEGTLLEVGGLAVMPNGDLAVSTRRGDVFIIENPTSARPHFKKFASGLHEVLGLAYKDGALYLAQRGELTKLRDTNADGRADVFETVVAWPLSGNYHEYSFGPKLAPDGSFFVTTNLGFTHPWWHAKSLVPWRGWTLKIDEKGSVTPWATGMRSPAGPGMIDGEFFYTDNQGDWVGSGGVWHVRKGSFTGHPGGLKWASEPQSPLKLRMDQIFAQVDPREEKNEQGEWVKPENRVDETFKTAAEMKRQFPEWQLPAVWLPHGIMGISNSEVLQIPDGHFGPFAGQLLVGDQGQSKIMRVVLEKVKGEFQGVAIDFRSGFRSGVLRMAWAQDGSLFVGETNRGWGSAGDANEGLERLVWNKRLPFEMRNVKAMPDGFEIEFTQPVDPKSAEDLASYAVESFIYKYHAVYGSPPVNRETAPIKGVKLSADGLKARLVVDNLRQYYIHQISLPGLRSKEGSYSLVHPTAYYTLNNIPEGQKLQLSELSTRSSAGASKAATKTAQAKSKATAKQAQLVSPDARGGAGASSTAQTSAKVPNFDEVKPLLAKHTCLACHNETKRQVGPSYVDIAKRKYSNTKIVELIHNPQPQNWPDYATEMPPMPQVPKDDALKIAAWINSLQ